MRSSVSSSAAWRRTVRFGILLGVQGGHVLDGDLRNVGRLRERGVRMFAPAHVMDNDVVGSGTGRAAGGLSDFGREVIGELEAQGMIVDLAHMSVAGIEQTHAAARRPFVLSHARAARRERAARAAAALLRGDAQRSGVSGSGSWRARRTVRRRHGHATARRLDAQSAGADMIRRALVAAGEANVAIGSDMDGALRC